MVERELQVIRMPRQQGGPFRLQRQSAVPIEVQLFVKFDEHGAAKYKVPGTRPKRRLTLLATERAIQLQERSEPVAKVRGPGNSTRDVGRLEPDLFKEMPQSFRPPPQSVPSEQSGLLSSMPRAPIAGSRARESPVTGVPQRATRTITARPLWRTGPVHATQRRRSRAVVRTSLMPPARRKDGCRPAGVPTHTGPPARPWPTSRGFVRRSRPRRMLLLPFS